MEETKPSQVVFYNWADYVSLEIAKAFEKGSGSELQQVYFSSNEEALAKLKAGASGYDVVVPSDWMVSVMTKSGLLEPLYIDYLPNFQYVGEEFKLAYCDDPGQNDGLKYNVPYFCGSTGYGRRTDKIAEETTDWTPLFDTQYKGKINILESPRETIGVGLLALGFSPNTTDQDELDAATAKMIEQKPLVATYDSTNTKRAIVQGQCLVRAWDGDVLQAIDALGGDEEAKALVDFVYPTEGFYT